MSADILPIAVIGAGFSGTMAAIHLRRMMPSQAIILYEKAGIFARGLAYSTTQSDHLLNVRATNMSAFPDQPEHFARWLETCPLDGLAWTRPTPAGLFAARGLYGQYLTDLLLTALSEPRPAPHLMLENDEVVDLAPAEDGFELTLAAGRRRRVAGAILACGNLRARREPHSHYAVDPWGDAPLGDLRPDLPLLIVGTGLTMVDAVASARQRGFSGPILAVSRRGLLPQVHAATASWPAPDVPVAARGSLPHLLRFVRDEVRRAAAVGVDWRSVIDALRSASIGLWRGLPLAEQRRFLRHVRAYWDVHRHRMAPPAAEIIARERASGGLSLMRARVMAVEDQAGHARVTLRERGADAPRVVNVQRIIDASGVGRVADTNDLLLRRLIARGLIRPDALGLGLAVTDDLAVVDQLGDASRPLWTLGPLLRGTLWECTAVPDIRGQAADLARTVAARLR